MNRPSKPAKMTVVLCSALLVAGFISYYAGAFDSLIGGPGRPSHNRSWQQSEPGTDKAGNKFLPGAKSW
jgi:hypothetical protein